MGGRLALLALLATTALAQVAVAGAGTDARCWQRVVRDWSDGRIGGAYPVACYRTALRKLPEDLRVYSSAPDDINAALQQRISRSSAHASRGLAVAGKRKAARASIDAAAGTGLDRSTVLAAALGAFGLALAVVGALVSRRR